MALLSIDTNSLARRDPKQFWGNEAVLSTYYRLAKASRTLQPSGTGPLTLLDGSIDEVKAGRILFVVIRSEVVLQLQVRAHSWRKGSDGSQELAVFSVPNDADSTGRYPWLSPATGNICNFNITSALSSGALVYKQQGSPALQPQDRFLERQMPSAAAQVPKAPQAEVRPPQPSRAAKPPPGALKVPKDDAAVVMANDDPSSSPEGSEEEGGDDDEYEAHVDMAVTDTSCGPPSQRHEVAEPAAGGSRRRRPRGKVAFQVEADKEPPSRKRAHQDTEAGPADTRPKERAVEVITTKCDQGFRELKEQVEGLRQAVEAATGHKRKKQKTDGSREAYIDASIKKIRQEPYFMNEAREDGQSPYEVFAAEAFGYKTESGEPSVALLRAEHTSAEIRKLKNDMSHNFKHSAMSEVRRTAASVYGTVGTAGAIAIVHDKTYRDKDCKRMADDRFQACIRAYYGKVRRVHAKDLEKIRDLSKLELTQGELALVDLEVQRTLRGDVTVSSGFLGVKSAEQLAAYKAAVTVVAAWRLSDMAPNLNIIDGKYVLGLAKIQMFLDDNTMALACKS